MSRPATLQDAVTIAAMWAAVIFAALYFEQPPPPPKPTPAAIAFVNNGACTVNTSATSITIVFPSNTGVGSLLVAGVMVGASGRTVTVSDNSGNPNWTQAKNQAQTTDGHEGFIHYLENDNGGANTVTVSISGAATSIRACVDEVTGIATSGALDQTNSAQADATSTITTGNVTTTQADEFIYAVGTTSSARTIAPGAGWTEAREAPAAPSSRISTDYRIESATGTFNGNMTITGGTTNVTGLIATFKASGAAVGARRRVLVLQ